jgi:hypothetical protein
MKEIKVISVCKTNCNSNVFKTVVEKKIDKNTGLPVKTKAGKDVMVSKEVTTYSKKTKAGWGMYVEITTLPNGKKASKTIHGPLP